MSKEQKELEKKDKIITNLEKQIKLIAKDNSHLRDELNIQIEYSKAQQKRFDEYSDARSLRTLQAIKVLTAHNR